MAFAYKPEYQSLLPTHPFCSNLPAVHFSFNQLLCGIEAAAASLHQGVTSIPRQPKPGVPGP